MMRTSDMVVFLFVVILCCLWFFFTGYQMGHSAGVESMMETLDDVVNNKIAEGRAETWEMH